MWQTDAKCQEDCVFFHKEHANEASWVLAGAKNAHKWESEETAL